MDKLYCNNMSFCENIGDEHVFPPITQVDNLKKTKRGVEERERGGRGREREGQEHILSEEED